MPVQRVDINIGAFSEQEQSHLSLAAAGSNMQCCALIIVSRVDVYSIFNEHLHMARSAVYSSG